MNIFLQGQVIDDVQQRKVYLVLEYVEGGPVMEDNRWIAFPEELAQKYFRDICCGLDYLHYHKVRFLQLVLKYGDETANVLPWT